MTYYQLHSNFSLNIVGDTSLLGSKEQMIVDNVNYVVDLLVKYINFKAPLDLEINVKPSSENQYNTDGLLPSIPEWVDYQGQQTLASIVKAQTGVDPNVDQADAGFYIIAGNDGTLKNYGSSLWFDPAPTQSKSANVPNGSHDFIGIVTHELFHALGFASWSETNAPWNQHTVNRNGSWFYSSASILNLLGQDLPLAPNEVDHAIADHYGNDRLQNQPVHSGLLYQWGYYDNNRFDIDKLSLLILSDLGYQIKNYEVLPIVDTIDGKNITGSQKADKISVGSFSSLISALGGNDSISMQSFGSNSNYLIDGGAGNDTVILKAESNSYIISYAYGDYIIRSLSGKDGVSAIRSIESIKFSDSIYSLASTNYGTAKNDIIACLNNGLAIYGYAGNDRLYGSSSADNLIGGIGSDYMYGSSGADTFTFLSSKEIGNGKSQDVIADFETGIDKIDISNIDANAKLKGLQHFTEISTSFTGQPGQLIFAGSILSGDLNGDKKADFTMCLSNTTTLSAHDLILG